MALNILLLRIQYGTAETIVNIESLECLSLVERKSRRDGRDNEEYGENLDDNIEKMLVIVKKFGLEIAENKRIMLFLGRYKGITKKAFDFAWIYVL